ncbi:hypothetical protein F1728_28920 [Gimesia benthica]|uniref:F-box/LRR-repeat protein 15-like leucin rich repeat domain-containing protein n=1 Tax=Gimesia benthica TaxID=2608982 RepID=A0A6I6AMJ4_9PLAN|nr:hypothetical protein [Gimesia benthica]QGQ26455.1 hypothetical protein F1728_28920 [Gimesia benthica]
MEELISFVESKGGRISQNEQGEFAWVFLTNQKVDDQDLDIFMQSGASQIAYLSLNGTQVTDEGLAKLASLYCLEKLDLGRTKITGTGFANVKFSSLKKLSLDKCDMLTVDGFKEIVKCQNFEKLNLIESNIDNEFLQEIAKLDKLLTLWIDDTKVTNAGLSCLNGMTQLKSLSIRGTTITREGMLQLWKHLPDLNKGLTM